MKRFAEFTRGFTLIEIMIVVAILGTLAAVAIPGFIAYVHTSKKNLCVSNLNTLNQATETYIISHGLDNDAEITLDMLSPKSDGETGGKQYLLKSRPVCPIGGTYLYDTENHVWTCSASNEDE